jgi:hypothetical protein
VALQLGVRRGLTTPTVKKIVYLGNYLQAQRVWPDSLARPKHRKMDMRFGTVLVMLHDALLGFDAV